MPALVRAGLSVLRQPLVIFLIGAGIIFLFDAVRPDTGTEAGARITVSEQQRDALSAGFERSWGRAPTDAELAALIDEWVEDEVFYRQAVALDLGADDPVIRRYLGNKMRFLSEDSVIVPEATEAELRTYFETHQSEFTSDPRYDLQIVRLPSMNGAGAREAMDALSSGTTVEAAVPGATSETYSAAGRVEVSRRFGISFYYDLASLEPGAWQGPLVSSVGLHFVRVDAVHAGEVPDFETARNRVLERWSQDRRDALEQAAFERLGSNYDLRPAEAGN